MLITNYHVDVARKVLDEVPSYSASRRLMFGSENTLLVENEWNSKMRND